jgi:hypothetical protein
LDEGRVPERSSEKLDEPDRMSAAMNALTQQLTCNACGLRQNLTQVMWIKCSMWYHPHAAHMPNAGMCITHVLHHLASSDEIRLHPAMKRLTQQLTCNAW